MSTPSTEPNKDIEMWKIKKLIKSLQDARGNGTSMISLIIPPKDQISRVSKMLNEEAGTANNIKSRVNRLSVLAAITSSIQRLKLYNKVPPNGLIIYCGTVMTPEGKERQVTIDFEPFKPINTSLYMCDNRFHTEALSELLEDDHRFGFIIMDGSGTLFGAVTGNNREVLHKFSVDLPKKHGRGGQSAVRFSRLRTERRHNYTRKVCELATQLFITNDRPNVYGLILAGSADFKTELSQSEMFDQRLVPKIIKIIDVSYGGENGFSQAISLSQDALANVKFVHEKKLLEQFFEQISTDSGLYCFGLHETLEALENGAISTLIVFENLTITRFQGKTRDGTERVLYLDLPAETDKIKDPKSDDEVEVTEAMSLVEWLTENYQKFGVVLEFISDRSPEGSQFVKGFGGIGGVLRYRLGGTGDEYGNAAESEDDMFFATDDEDDDFF
ncbi:eukaryotic peptide chain release factor subunit 1 [Fonticula alba]|uniref:Eukaryotic peptide chain release factor subunit 1 n=1 Tax=Fonticula alba TaxID=691883 RepID=A0A058ZBF9_FONAL|nr:eukaryotic peptide chain release factor subunit 1 [Fonticula alba]KCV70762.1 eukaryotic peptide chain release factor subunit 1 [Fonticula alba]|eukprot:XP_009495278.1 eukaryotic peptide chain release factor subunit 1 [Fonticula alba]